MAFQSHIPRTIHRTIVVSVDVHGLGWQSDVVPQIVP